MFRVANQLILGSGEARVFDHPYLWTVKIGFQGKEGGSIKVIQQISYFNEKNEEQTDGKEFNLIIGKTGILQYETTNAIAEIQNLTGELLIIDYVEDTTKGAASSSGDMEGHAETPYSNYYESVMAHIPSEDSKLNIKEGAVNGNSN